MAYPRPVHIAVLCGGISQERAVSLRSGHTAADALSRFFPVDLIELNEPALPTGLSSDRDIIFPMLHGTFGEDGAIQNLLERDGFVYAGSDAQASRTCFNKKLTKEYAARVGAFTAPDVVLDIQSPSDLPDAYMLIQRLGEDIIIKPLCQGSSIGLYCVSGVEELTKTMARLPPGGWLCEQRIIGRELSIGLLKGKTLSLVEIVPEGNSPYDYAHKYTAGSTQYHCPAAVAPEIANQVGKTAERVFATCGCRDFARADFMLNAAREAFFLEINTLPGLTATSLLPQSARGSGYGLDELLRQMVLPAIERFMRQFC